MYNTERCFELLKKISFNRVAGSPEEDKARAILKAEVESMGLTTEEEEFPIDYAEIEKATLEITSPYHKEYTVTGIKMSGNTSEEGIEAPLVYVENAEDANLTDIEGKIILLNGRMMYSVYKKIITEKPAGFIALSGSVYDELENSDLEEMAIRKKLYDLGKIPGVCLRAIDGQEILNSGATRAKIILRQKEGSALSHDLITEIRGTEKPEEIIAITAHYDSVPFSSGAYDNASGAVGIMELLRHFVENKPSRTLRFIWCGGEELGLMGSKAYCEKHKEEMNKFVFCLNIDMIGVTLGYEIACCTAEESLPHYIAYLGKELGIAIKARQGVYSSDSTPFADHGVPSVSFARISPMGGAKIHSRKDVIDNLNAASFDSSLRIMTEFASRMVNSRTFPVTRTIPDNMKLELDYYMMRKDRPER